jgi:hypothetical protein
MKSKWIIMKYEQTAGAVTGDITFRLLSTGSGRFKTPNYTVNGGITLQIIDFNLAATRCPEYDSRTLTGIVASTPTSVTVQNRYTVLNRSTYDHYLFTITPKRASTYLQRVDIQFPNTYQWI